MTGQKNDTTDWQFFRWLELWHPEGFISYCVKNRNSMRSYKQMLKRKKRIKMRISAAGMSLLTPFLTTL